MSQLERRQRIHPIKQQTLDTSPEDFRVGISVNTSTVDAFAAIHADEYQTPTKETPSEISPEQLFQSYRGKQLHVLNQLMIMVIREVKRFYHKVNANYTSSELSIGDLLLPVKLQFTQQLIRKYFPEFTHEEAETWSSMITNRIDEFPDVAPGSSEYLQLQLGKKRVKQIKAIDIPQLVFDVWNDWRFNQSFSLKRGVVQSPKKNSNYFVRAKEILTLNREIWEDGYEPKKGLIEVAAIETLASWRLLLSNPELWQSATVKPTDSIQKIENSLLIGELLDIRNKIFFEQVINIRYLLDEIEDGPVTDAILSANISGQPDIILLIPTADGGVKVMLIDIKTTLRNKETLETLLTLMQAKAAPWVRPRSKSPVPMMASDLAESDLSLYEVVHINPLAVIQLAAGIFDFESETQQTFNTFQDRFLLQAIVQDAALHPKKYKDRILNHKHRNQVPVKMTLDGKIIPVTRKLLPSLEKQLIKHFHLAEASKVTGIDLGNPETTNTHAQPILPGLERAAIKKFTLKTPPKRKPRSA